MRMHFHEINEIKEDKGERRLPASDDFKFPKELKVKPMFAKELQCHELDDDFMTDAWNWVLEQVTSSSQSNSNPDSTKE